MNDPLLAHRFRLLEILDEDSGFVLMRAHDAASAADGWLLKLTGAGRTHTRAAVQLRLHLFAGRSLARDYSIGVQLGFEQDSFFFMHAPHGARPIAAEDLDARQLAVLRDGLVDWADFGIAAGALSSARLWVDEGGPFLLPTAYCLPPDERSTACFDWRERGRCRRQVEQLVAQFRHRGTEVALPAAETGVSRPALAPAFLKSITRSLGGGACMRVGGSVDVAFLSATLSDWSEAQGRSYLELRPFVGTRVSARKVGSSSPVIFLSGSSHYTAFAESLYRLDRAGWLDGNETVILAAEDQDLDEAMRLYTRSSKTFESWDVQDVLLEAPVTNPSGTGPVHRNAQQVLDALRVARRPVSDVVLASALAMDTADLVEALGGLHHAGRVGLGFGLAEELARVPALLAEAYVPVGEREKPATLRDGMGELLAVAVLAQPRRAQWGNAWIRIEAAAISDPPTVGPQLRELAERARKEGLALLEYACYDRLLHWADITEPRLEDRSRAAIRQAHEHRRLGELDRTDQVLRSALEALQSRVDMPPERVAPLICDLVLERAHLSLHRSRFSEAEEQLRATLDRFRDHLPEVQRARIYLDLSWALLQMGRTRESMDPCNLALRLVDTVRHSQLVARAYNQLGYAHYKESDYETSIRCFQRALILRQQVGDDLAVARTYNNLSLSQRGLGQLHEAEQSLHESLRLKRAAGDHRGAAASLLNLGFVYLDQRNFDEAKRCGMECLRAAEELRHPETEAESYGLLGEVAAGRGELEEAQRYLQRDLDLCEANGHQAERLATLRRLVDVLLRSDRTEEAARLLESARELLVRQPSRLEAAMLDRLEGELFVRHDAHDPAGDAFGSAARIFASLRQPAEQVDCLMRRARSEFALNHQDAARQTLRDLREIALRSELATLPDEVRDLETRLGPSRATPADSSPETLLQRAADLLREEYPDAAPEPRRWLSAAVSVLGAEQALWLVQDPGEGPRVEASAVALRGLPSVLRQLDHEGLELGESASAEDGWLAIAAPRGHWLCVQSTRELGPIDRAFLVVVAWSLCPRSGRAAPPRPELPVPRTQDREAQPQSIIGQSAAIQRMLATVDTVSATEVTVLLLGENGTGKDLVARAIHRQSGRTGRPFVALNCASIPPSLLESELFGHEKGAFTSAHERRPGVFERAEGGTIFLDEIGEMPLPMQAKMLRVLQDRRFTRVGGADVLEADVRVIAATNRNLLDEVREGHFRMDLYYRLNVVSIEIPPLRERQEDIEILVDHFVRLHAPALGSPVRRVSREALARLRDYSWPGNVRELENVIKNALVFTRDPIIRSENLPEGVLDRDVTKAGRSVEQAVQAMILSEDWSEDRPLLPRVELLLAHEAVTHLGNKTLAAKILGITKPTLYSRLRRFHALYGGGDEAAGQG